MRRGVYYDARIFVIGWQPEMRKILVVLGCLQHEQQPRHQRCAATHFSPKVRQQIKLKTNRGAGAGADMSK